MGLPEMAESSISVIFCSDITKFNELLTGPIAENMSYYSDLNWTLWKPHKLS